MSIRFLKQRDKSTVGALFRWALRVIGNREQVSKNLGWWRARVPVSLFVFGGEAVDGC